LMISRASMGFIPSFRGGREATEPGISRFPDVQLHI
jgi:hypothetical protein